MSEHPAVAAHRRQRAEDWQLRVADWITAFAGSMTFIYIHAVWFVAWLVAGMDINLLTLIVSLEAIFLTTFVMIGQNRQAAFAARKADHDYEYQVKELQHNTELTTEIHALVTELHARKKRTRLLKGDTR